MRTIRRNAKKQIAAIFENAIACKVFSLNNGFSGEAVSIEAARNAYEQFDFARLYESGAGSYTVHIHSNLFYIVNA